MVEPKLEIDKLLSQPKEDVGRQLFAQPDSILPFLQHVAGDLPTVTRDPVGALRGCLVWMRLICGNGDPEGAFRHLKIQSSSCGKTWREGELAYKCNTCQADPTCAICIECFNKGNHTGHDYRMIRTGGGMCDCGDSSAWNPAGFCSDHKGLQEGEDPTEAMPSNAKLAIVNCCFFLLRMTEELCTALLASERSDASTFGITSNAADIIEAVKKALSWTEEVAQMGDTAKRIIAIAFAGFPVPWPPRIALPNDAEYFTLLERCFRLEFQPLNEVILQSLHTVYISVMTDHLFKNSFARLYMQFYDQLSSADYRRHRNDPDRTDDTLMHFSVQFLTVPGVVQTLLQPQPPDNTHALHTMMDTLKKLTEGLCHPKRVGHTQSTKMDLIALPNGKYIRWIEVVRDIRYCMVTSLAVTGEVQKDPRLLNALMLVMQRVQGSSIVERKDSDDSSWQWAFEYEKQFALLLFKWHEALASEWSKDPGNAGNHATVPATVNDVSQALIQAIRSFTLEMELAGPHAQPDPQTPWLVDYNVLTHPFTFHLPLHRFFASTLSISCTARPNTPVHCLVPDALVPSTYNANVEEGPPLPPLIVLLVEHPLALQAARAQVRNMLWQRNNMNIMQQTEYYESNFFRAYSWALDMFLMQVAAVLLGPSYYVSLVVERFKLIFEDPPGSKQLQHLRPISSHPLPSSPLDPQKMGESLLGHLLATAMDRTRCGFSHSQNLRRQLIHQLAMGKRGHSELLKAIPRYQTDEDEDEEEGPVDVETLIAEIADFTPPSTAAQQGYFTLKKECWAEVDLHFPLAAAEQMTQITANRRQCLGKDARHHPAPYLPPPPFSNFTPLLGILHCELTHSLLFASLVKNDSSMGIALDMLLLALWTLDAWQQSCAEYTKQREEEFYTKLRPHADHLYPFRLPGSNLLENVHSPLPPSGQSMLHRLLTLLYSKEGADHSETLEEILDALAKNSAQCQADISAFRTEMGCNKTGSADQTDLKKERARRKHAETLRKMQAQQMKFESLLDTEAWEEAEEEATVAEEGQGHSHLVDMAKLLGQEACVLCHQQQSPEGSTQLSFVCQVTRSNVLKQASTQAVSRDPKLPSVAVGCDNQVLCTALGPEGYLIVTSPAFNDAIQDTNLHLLFCGHAMHLDCFDSHHSFMCKSMMGNMDYTFKGAHYIHVQRGEYLCPLCGRIGNTVCPVVCESKSCLLQDSPAPPPPIPVEGAEEEQLWREIVVYMEDTYNPVPPKRYPDDPNRRLDDALDSFVEMLYMTLTRSSRMHFFAKCCYRGQQDLFSCGITCIAMYISALELAARSNNLENGVLHISIRSGGLMRAVLRALLAYSRRQPFHTDDARNVVNCVAGKTCVVTEEEQWANPNAAGEFELRWPALLSCDVYAVALQLLFMVVLREEAFNMAHYRAVLCRMFQAHVLRTLVALLAPDPQLSLPADDTVHPAFQEMCSRTRDFLMKQLYVNGPVRARKPSSPVARSPAGFDDSASRPQCGPTPTSSSSSSSAATSTYPEEGVSSGPINTMAILQQEVKRGCVVFMRRWALLHYALTGSPLPHILGQVDDSSTHSASLAPGPPLMLATPESDDVSLAALAVYLQLPSPDDVVAGACLALLRPLGGDQRNTLMNKWLSQLASAADVTPAPYRPSEARASEWPAKKRKREGASGGSSKPQGEGGGSTSGQVPDQKPESLEGDDVGAEEEEEDEEEEMSDTGSELVAVLNNDLAEQFDLWQGSPSLAEDEVTISADDVEEFVHKGTYLPLLPEPTGNTYPYRLIPLPSLYQHLAQKYYAVRCRNCPNATRGPDQPALCLLCGEIVCCSSKCCTRNDMGECAAHSLTCGGGVGVYLLTKKTTLLVQRNERFSVLSSLYLDVHGEEDHDLQRGRPLHLSRSRYQELLQLVTTCSFDHDTRVLAYTRSTRWASL